MALVLCIALFFTTLGYCQDLDNFGILSKEEMAFTEYPADSTANAVVMYERGNNFFAVRDNRIWLIKKYYGKIKILNEKGLDEGNISIPLYRNSKNRETIEKLRAITHNSGGAKRELLASEVFSVDVNEWYTKKRFTFPNVKKGSILEYRYTVVSPFFFKLEGWNFQSHIPKIYSEFNAKIPSNYKYNRTLLGALPLAANDATIESACFYVDGYPNPADCEVLRYAVRNAPAFNADDAYMLATSNYISRLDFELAEYYTFQGAKVKYSKSWKDVDRDFKKDKDIGRQLTKKGFFEKNVPESLLSTGDELTRAQNIYNFIRGYYTWNGKYGIYDKVRVKDAFNKKIGNVGEINISLINLLNAANINTNLMLLSTRQNGLPKKNRPVLSDFNYVVAKVHIDGKDYILDATDKSIPFGMLPFRCLNYQGRVMDFKKESYWYDIAAYDNNKNMYRVQLDFQPEEEKFVGKINQLTFGYNAVNKRRAFAESSEDSYLKNIENSFVDDFLITEYTLNDAQSDEKKVSERFEFELETSVTSDNIYLDPFFIKFFRKNPFIQEKRNYPIDFGYNREYAFHLIFNVPEGYKIKDLPKKKVVALPEQMGKLKFDCRPQGNSIILLFDVAINSSHYSTEKYEMLKEFFKHITEVQNNTLIALEKV